MSKPSKSPTIYDVAKVAQVSEATVSHVLNQRQGGTIRVSEETRQRVLEAVEKLGYVSNLSAQSLSRRKTDRICLVLPRFGAPFMDVLARDVKQAAHKYGYTTITVTMGSEEEEYQVLEQLRRRMADGILIIDPEYITEDDLAPLVKTGLAVVVRSNRLEPAGFDVIRTGEVQARRQAVDYLVAKGHRRIALLGNALNPNHQARLEAYQQLLTAHGHPVEEDLIHGDAHSRQTAYSIAQALLRLNEPPTAILAATDVIAISALWAAYAANRRIPADVAIVGLGNIPDAAITHPPLTTVGPVSLDFSNIIALLVSRLKEGPLQGRVHTHDYQLILRGSA